MAKAEKKSTLQKAVEWLRAQEIIETENNYEIAAMIPYSAARFSSIWNGAPPSPRFVKQFEDTFLKKHNYRWEDFEQGPPLSQNTTQEEHGYIMMNARLTATVEVLMQQMKLLHDKIDDLTTKMNALIDSKKITA